MGWKFLFRNLIKQVDAAQMKTLKMIIVLSFIKKSLIFCVAADCE